MKVSRNDYCPCGSGKKYKNCHWGKEDFAIPQKSSPPPARADLDDLDPAKADVMSSEYWEKMSKRLPRDMRKEFRPIIARVKQHVEMESHREQIEAASQVLEAHRTEYVKLTKDTSAFFQRAEKLFGEKPFVDMRFGAAAVHRAFEAVGYPPPGRFDKKFMEIMNNAVNFLVDDAQRRTLAQRLMLVLPDYVNAGRYLDGWIIQHSVDMTAEPLEGVVGPFLLAMFMHGMRDWEDQREQEQRAMFEEIGLSPEELGQMGHDGLEAWLRDMRDKPDKIAAMEKFLARHPELNAMSQAQCHAAEEAAQKLLQREDARVLWLSPKELRPWLSVLEKRLMEAPDGFASLLRTQPPDDAITKAFVDIVHDVATEMTKAVFTPARIAQLKSQLYELRRGFSAEDDRDALDGVHGALIAAQAATAPEDSHFLKSVCWVSLMASLEAVAAAQTDKEQK